MPNATAELMDVVKSVQGLIDTKNSQQLSTLDADTRNELESKKNEAKKSQSFTPLESAVSDQHATLMLIREKQASYKATSPSIYGMRGQSPYFLMDILSSNKISDLLHGDKSSSFEAILTTIDSVWRSALELKSLSMQINILSAELNKTGGEVHQLSTFLPRHDIDWEADQNKRLDTIGLERDVYIHNLPEFLQLEFVAKAGSVTGLTVIQAMKRYRETLKNMALWLTSNIKPIVAPPPLSYGGITIKRPAANPKIKAPLLKPEVEALNELVYLQAHTNLGIKWQSYHDALLKEESARHLTVAVSALDGLVDRLKAEENLTEEKRLSNERMRLAAEAEIKRVDDEQKRLATEAIIAGNAFHLSAPASAAKLVFATSTGAMIVETGALTLQAAIRAGIAALTNIAAGTASGFMVGVSALVYSPKLANGELPERYALSMPLSNLAADHEVSLPSVVEGAAYTELPIRMSSRVTDEGRSEVVLFKSDGFSIPAKVRTIAAIYNAEQNLYTATTADIPPRTLTWTPAVSPENQSTHLPSEQPATPVYTGATVTPAVGRIDTFPEVSAAGFDDFITVFPADSGMPPVYVMFRDPREDAGVATGNGQAVSGLWLGAASQGNGAPIPSQIADQLRGREFKNFRAFRRAFWTAVSNDAELVGQFNSRNRSAMTKGFAAFVRKSEALGGRRRYELHHLLYISQDGEVYDIDNVHVTTPKLHVEIHRSHK